MYTYIYICIYISIYIFMYVYYIYSNLAISSHIYLLLMGFAPYTIFQAQQRRSVTARWTFSRVVESVCCEHWKRWMRRRASGWCEIPLHAYNDNHNANNDLEFVMIEYIQNAVFFVCVSLCFIMLSILYYYGCPVAFDMCDINTENNIILSTVYDTIVRVTWMYVLHM